MAGKLYTPPRTPEMRDLVIRLLIVLALIGSATVVVYLEGGLWDTHKEQKPGLKDCLYYTIITITTVGYGDIVPIDTKSRLTDALLLTPIRFIVLFLIFGTAYQLAIKRFREEYRMKRVTEKLDGHTVICGFGATGHAALTELLLQGTASEQIVVLDINAEALDEASEKQVVCIQGDATRENVLNTIELEKAASVLVCPGRDDTAVLITLTVRALNPNATIIAMCQEEENVKLLKRSGAHHIVHPAFAGGSLMAAATRQEHLVETMEDLLSVGGVLQLNERPVLAEEIGQSAAELQNIAVLRVYRNKHFFDVDELPALQEGDVLVFINRVGEN